MRAVRVRNYHSVAPIVRKAKIISLSNPDDDANARLHHGTLPEGTCLLAIGTKLEEFDMEELQKEQPNVIFVSHPKVQYCTMWSKCILLDLIFCMVHTDSISSSPVYSLGTRTIGPIARGTSQLGMGLHAIRGNRLLHI
jgi:hypothetical protein